MSASTFRRVAPGRGWLSSLHATSTPPFVRSNTDVAPMPTRASVASSVLSVSMSPDRGRPRSISSCDRLSPTIHSLTLAMNIDPWKLLPPH